MCFLFPAPAAAFPAAAAAPKPLVVVVVVVVVVCMLRGVTWAWCDRSIERGGGCLLRSNQILLQMEQGSRVGGRELSLSEFTRATSAKRIQRMSCILSVIGSQSILTIIYEIQVTFAFEHLHGFDVLELKEKYLSIRRARTMACNRFARSRSPWDRIPTL